MRLKKASIADTSVRIASLSPSFDDSLELKVRGLIAQKSLRRSPENTFLAGRPSDHGKQLIEVGNIGKTDPKHEETDKTLMQKTLHSQANSSDTESKHR